MSLSTFMLKIFIPGVLLLILLFISGCQSKAETSATDTFDNHQADNLNPQPVLSVATHPEKKITETGSRQPAIAATISGA